MQEAASHHPARASGSVQQPGQCQERVAQTAVSDDELEECQTRRAATVSKYLFIVIAPVPRRTSVTRAPQTEKAALQVSAKISDKVPGAAIIGEDEKENNKEVPSVPAPVLTAPLAVPEVTLITTATLVTPTKVN